MRPWAAVIIALVWPLPIAAFVVKVSTIWSGDASHDFGVAGLYLCYAVIGAIYAVSYRLYARGEPLPRNLVRRDFAIVVVTCVGATVFTGLASVAALVIADSARVDFGRLTGSLIMASAAMAFMNGVAEEFALRGILQCFLIKRWSFIIVALIQGVIFSGLHTIAVGQNAESALYYFISGFFYSFVAFRFGSVSLCAAIHVVWDFLQLPFYGVQTWVDHQDGILLTTLLASHRYLAWTLAKCLLLACVIWMPAAFGFQRKLRVA